MATPQATAVDIGELLDKQKLSLFHLGTFLLCALIIIVDAADTGSANVAAPAILRAFPAERSVMGWVFAWGAIGVFFGSLIFGYIGDRYGRRAGVLLSVLFYSIPALGTASAGSLEQLMIWRFVTGLGIGGAIPNTIALLNEAAPKRFRASFVVFAFLGYSIGTGSSGAVAGWFTPIYGWISVFVAVGIAGSLLVVLLYFRLPESLRYLVVTDSNSPVLRRRAAKLFPEAGIGPETRFVLVQEERATRVALRELFVGNLKLTTPLLWLSYFCEILHLSRFYRLAQHDHGDGRAVAQRSGVCLLLCRVRRYPRAALHVAAARFLRADRVGGHGDHRHRRHADDRRLRFVGWDLRAAGGDRACLLRRHA